MNEKTIGDKITEEILNENFPTREMKIQHLKNISDAIKSDPELKEQLKKDLSFYTSDSKANEKLEKSKRLVLTNALTRRYNGFASLLVLCLITLFFSGGSLLYILIVNGFFK